MPSFSRPRLMRLIHQAKNGTDSNERGRALENAASHSIECLPGIITSIRNAVDYAEGGEIDILFANRPHDKGLWFLPTVFLVECKNWANRVGSQELRVLIDRLRERACSLGILVCTNGITGDQSELTSAHHHVSRALEDGRHILVVSLAELAEVRTRNDMVQLLLSKWMQLKTFKTSL